MSLKEHGTVAEQMPHISAIVFGTHLAKSSCLGQLISQMRPIFQAFLLRRLAARSPVPKTTTRMIALATAAHNLQRNGESDAEE
jgi:hypothetical protein